MAKDNNHGISGSTWNRRFIVELRDIAMNIIPLLHVKIESKSSTFGVKEISGEEREFFLSVSYSRVVEL